MVSATTAHSPNDAVVRQWRGALPKIIDPVQAFNALFGGIAAPSDPGSQAAADHKRKVGRASWISCAVTIGKLRAKLGPVEQQKLDQHLTSLREIEKQLMPTVTTASCGVPPLPDATKFPKIKQYKRRRALLRRHRGRTDRASRQCDRVRRDALRDAIFERPELRWKSPRAPATITPTWRTRTAPPPSATTAAPATAIPRPGSRSRSSTATALEIAKLMQRLDRARRALTHAHLPSRATWGTRACTARKKRSHGARRRSRRKFRMGRHVKPRRDATTERRGARPATPTFVACRTITCSSRSRRRSAPGRQLRHPDRKQAHDRCDERSHLNRLPRPRRGG